LSTENEDIQFIYIDAEKMPGSRSFADVNNLPTFVGFVDGKLVSQSQSNKIEVIEGVLSSVRNS
jgi:hypothetical protein